MECLFRAFVCALLAVVSVAAQPAGGDQIEKYVREGEKALAQNRYAEAEAAFEKLRQLAPGTAEVYGTLGLIYFQQAKYEQAVSVLRQGLKLKPSLPRAAILLAMSLSELGRFQDALPGLQKAFKTTDAELKRMTGLQLQRAYTGLGRDRDAVEIAIELNRLYPDDPEILYHTARLFGNYAFVTMRKLAEVAPMSPWRYQAAGEVHESQGNYELAIAAYKQVLTMNPERPGIHLRIGRALLAARQDNFEREAASEFEQELRLDPTNANAAYELAEVLRRQGQLAKARELFEIAIKHYPEFGEAHIALGRVLVALNQAQPAIAHLQKAVALSPDSAVAWFHLARAYQAAGDSVQQQKALTAFQRIRADARKREETGMKMFFPQEATRQELDAGAGP